MFLRVGVTNEKCSTVPIKLSKSGSHFANYMCNKQNTPIKQFTLVNIFFYKKNASKKRATVVSLWSSLPFLSGHIEFCCNFLFKYNIISARCLSVSTVASKMKLEGLIKVFRVVHPNRVNKINSGYNTILIWNADCYNCLLYVPCQMVLQYRVHQ